MQRTYLNGWPQNMPTLGQHFSVSVFIISINIMV